MTDTAEAEAVAKEADKAETGLSSCLGARPKMPSSHPHDSSVSTRPENLAATQILKRLLHKGKGGKGGKDGTEMTLAKEANEAKKELDAAEEDVKKKAEEELDAARTLAEAEDLVKAAELNLAGCQKKLMDAQADLDRMKAGNPVTQQAAVPGEATLEGTAALRPSPSRPPRAPSRHGEPRPPATPPSVHAVVRMACTALREDGKDGIARMLEAVMADCQ